jgi:mannose-6-phosphate isomerase-like protein (cupin superfamily)
MAGDVVAVGDVRVTYVHDDPASAYALLAWDAPPAAPPPPLHVHHHTEEGFYIASGRYRFLIGGETIECGAGDHVRVAPGVPHTFWNCGDERAVALIIVTPPAFAAYFRELSRGLASANGDEAWVEVRRELSSQFDIAVLGG